MDLANLNINFAIPVIGKAGRGLPLSYSLRYDSSIWGAVGGQWYLALTDMGWRGIAEALTGFAGDSAVTGGCYINSYGYSYNIYGPRTYTEPNGTTHYFSSVTVSNGS